MENNCKNCGNLIFDKMAICHSCFEELSAKKKVDLKKKKEKWKKEWESTEGNWFLTKFSITNPYYGAVIFHFLIVLGLFIVWGLWGYLMSYSARFFVAILGESIGATGAKGFIGGATIGLSIYSIKYLYRLLFFISNRF
tara:strand:- start:2293 stop:2709 length:417 start_codon:yes stop_codon:yes gene_type:complete